MRITRGNDFSRMYHRHKKLAEHVQHEALSLLSELTSRLERVVSKLGPHGSTTRQLPPRSTSYLLPTLPTGLTCTQLSQEEVALQSSFMKQEDISKLRADFFRMVRLVYTICDQ